MENKKPKTEDILFDEFTDLQDKYNEIKEQLLQSERMASVGTLSAGIAHELNNPLTGILGYSGLLLKDRSISEENLKNVARISELAQRMNGTIKNLTQLVKETSRKDKKPTCLVKTLKFITEIYEKKLQFDNIEIRVQSLSHKVNVLSGNNLLENIFQHLISNSIDAYVYNHILENRKILIEIKKDEEGKNALISFMDFAGGIPDEILPKIFDPFFTTKDVGVGSGGLGLSVVKQIANDLGGRINVEVEKGFATIFKLSFPLCEGEAKPVFRKHQPPVNTKNLGITKPTLLLIDDEEFICDLAMQTLGDDFEIKTVNCPIDALKILSDTSFDIVVTDLKMPKLPGEKIGSYIKNRHKETSLVVMSGHAFINKTEELEELEPFLFIEKPFKSSDDVVDKILKFHMDKKDENKKAS